MQIKCGGCDREEAQVFCCADAAALCLGCDEKIHATNQLMSKHQRVSLSAPSFSSPRPKCDICQETVGFFFCLEDRALLCRKCDISIHTMNSFVSCHQRFLLVGAKVGLESVVSNDSVRITRDSSTVGLPQIAEKGNLTDGFEMAEGGSPADGSEMAVEAETEAITDSKAKALLYSNCDVATNSFVSDQQRFLLDEKDEGQLNDNSSGWWKILRSTEELLMNDEWMTTNLTLKVPDMFRRYSQADSVSSRDIGTSSNNELNISDIALSDIGSESNLDVVSAKRRRL